MSASRASMVKPFEQHGQDLTGARAVTLSTFASLRVHAAKASLEGRGDASLLLRCAQDKAQHDSGLLQAAGVIHQPLQILYSQVAIFIGIVYNYLPLMVFPLYVSLERMDKRLVEASKDLGAGRLSTFRQVTLSLTLPGVMTGCLLFFIPLTGEYLIPTILGGSKNIFMESLIANQFLEVHDWPFGAALGVVVMALLLVLVNIYLMVFRRAQSVPGL